MTEQLIYIAVMAVITYLIRVLPITVFRKEITSQWLMSFLHYVPYAVLAGLTAGTLVALVLAYFDMGLVIVAVGAVAGALLAGIF